MFKKPLIYIHVIYILHVYKFMYLRMLYLTAFTNINAK